MANDNRGPENLADILGRLFTSRGWGRKNDRMRLESAWAAVAGEELLKDTHVLGMRRGVPASSLLRLRLATGSCAISILACHC